MVRLVLNFALWWSKNALCLGSYNFKRPKKAYEGVLTAAILDLSKLLVKRFINLICEEIFGKTL